jgi:sulfatase maturation enzyme AslB (radical SAM superfamily)
MPVARFTRLLDGLPRHPVALSLSGFGEPLVHPEFLALVRLARERDVQVEIITNGTLLDAALARELIALGVAQVTVSIDGGDETAYAAVRGHSREPAVAAVVALVEARQRARRGLEIGLACVATRRNIGSLPALLALAHDLELDFVSVSNVVPHTPEMAAEMLWGGAAWAASGQKCGPFYFPDASWRPRLEMGRIDLDAHTRSALAAIWDRALTWPPPGRGGPQRNHCRFTHEGVLAVAWDGRVAPCLSAAHPPRTRQRPSARRRLRVIQSDISTNVRCWTSGGT